MSSIILKFHPFIVLMFCFFVFLTQAILRSNMPVLDKVLLLGLSGLLQFVTVIFEIWRIERDQTHV